MGFELNKKRGYFKDHGVDVMAFDDIYPEGHQSGISVIMHDKRLLTNGDIRFEPTPGQWQSVSKQDERKVNEEEGSITTSLHFPDEDTHLKGLNPRIYPDFEFNYVVKASKTDDGIEVTVDLDREVPDEFAGKLCFNMEIFPGEVYEKTYIMDKRSGIFPSQPNGPACVTEGNRKSFRKDPFGKADGIYADADALMGDPLSYSPIVADDIIAEPYDEGYEFVLCPEDPYKRVTIISQNAPWKLYDGRFNHNNGWFAISAQIGKGATEGAVKFKIIPNVIRDYEYEPVIQISNVGYHPLQKKVAIIELDHNSQLSSAEKAKLILITKDGEKLKGEYEAKPFGDFLRYKYLCVDFSDVKDEGMFSVEYKGSRSSVFKIADDVYERGVWQPVIEYFLPVQMCHMRVNEKYRVWHGRCHTDDAAMAPINRNHFDGYVQGASTLTKYKSGEHVPGLNSGGWHDAGDFDLRIESQSGEAYILSLCVEEFGAFWDSTMIDQKIQTAEIHQPDGVNDFLQQIEHGLLSVVGAYRSLGRLYKGIICNDLRQYVLLGDPVNMTDKIPGNEDDRWVFTENNPVHELHACAHLSAAGRVIASYRPKLSKDAIDAAVKIYEQSEDSGDGLNDLAEALYKDDGGKALEREKQNIIKARIHAACELYRTLKDDKYLSDIVSYKDLILSDMDGIAAEVAGVYEYIKDEEFKAEFRDALLSYKEELDKLSLETPYGVPYRPHIWGAGWGIQAAAFRYYFLYKAFPDIFTPDLLYASLNFVLGTHPGRNNASFASGVGSNSVKMAYGFNRADRSYIPGGVVSGTALIRPDFPELLTFPFLWQQTEYVLGGGSSHYMFMVLAVSKLIKDGIFDR